MPNRMREHSLRLMHVVVLQIGVRTRRKFLFFWAIAFFAKDFCIKVADRGEMIGHFFGGCFCLAQKSTLSTRMKF